MASLFEHLKEVEEKFLEGAWYDYKSENQFAAEEATKERPWFTIETGHDEISPTAIARFRTTNPKGNPRKNYKHKKYGEFTKDGWIPNIRRSINYKTAKFKTVEDDSELENKIRSFYRKVR